MNKRLRRFEILYPIFAGFSGDLLFWVAIDTLFLSTVKHLSNSEIVSLTTVSLVSCIVLQPVLLWIIRKIGNTASIRLGVLFSLASALLLTFGTQYYMFAAAKIVLEISISFRNMNGAMLKNNLDLDGKGGQFILYTSRGMTIYSVVTMLISFVAGWMFNADPYLPMWCCIGFCVFCCLLSFFLADYSDGKPAEPAVKPEKKKVKIRFTGILILFLIIYAIYYPVIISSQDDGKLFIQSVLLDHYQLEQTTLMLTGMVCVSRVVRVISNLFFNRFYVRTGDRIGVILLTMMPVSIGCLLTGYALRENPMISFILMSLGYIIILFVRDPFRFYVQDRVLMKVSKEEQQTMLTLMDFLRRIVLMMMSFSFTLLLVRFPMVVIVFILGILALTSLGIGIRLLLLIRKEQRN